MPSLLEKSTHKTFLSNLLHWYRQDGRHDMPWRKTKDPYAIFVSEYMLQQTTVATVVPYYDRFLKRFPTVSSLAEADLNDVLALWSGLGYYARARNLWAAMRTIQDDFGGKVPSDPEKLLSLPGVGYYTAGAIISLAYNKPAAVLDGNIIRVLMRLFGLDDDPKLKAIQVVLRKFVTDLSTFSLKNKIKPNRSTKGGPRDVVLALMDIGATVCLPKNPQCLVCPMAKDCLAKKHGRQEDIPPKGEKIQRPTVRRLFALVQHKGKWLVGQRPKGGLFGGLWEFIGVDSSPGVNPVHYLEEGAEAELGFPIVVQEAVPAFEHQLTHKIMVIRPYLCRLKQKDKRWGLPKKGGHYERFKWITPSSLNRMGISSITKRIVNSLKTKPLDVN